MRIDGPALCDMLQGQRILHTGNSLLGIYSFNGQDKKAVHFLEALVLGREQNSYVCLWMATDC